MADTMAESTTHIAGVDVELEGRYLRQRCSWCGAILIDEDYARLAMPGEWKKPRTFAIGKLVLVIEGNPRMLRAIEDEAVRLPDDFCGAAVFAEPRDA